MTQQLKDICTALPENLSLLPCINTGSSQQPATPSLGDPTLFGHGYSRFTQFPKSSNSKASFSSNYRTDHTHKVGVSHLDYRGQSTRDLLDLVRLPAQKKKQELFPPLLSYKNESIIQSKATTSIY